ncbi:MAG: SpoIIIAH-like family protein [Eubacteriales bacterium]|jgi:stage III sporulation protein AH|nr:SpoIIIAH-like family protein [Clostridiales bacterium]
MKKEVIREKFDKIKEKCALAMKKIGAKNLIIICAVLLCGVAIGLNFIIPAIINNDKKANGIYTIDSDYYSDILANGGEARTDDEAQNAFGDTDDEDNSSDYFVNAMLSRNRARDEAIEVLNTVMRSETAVDEIRIQAQEDIAQIAKDIEAEANIEALIKAKGFEDCVAVISGGEITVIVKAKNLLPSEVAQITEIIYKKAGILPVNMNIIEKD